ncbi:MAG: hypothetical protein ABIT83_05715 [Massilia sp.]
MDRYQGKPFLRLLDSYLLDVIGQLGAPQQQVMLEVQPTLARTFNFNGSWQELVVKQLELPVDFPDSVRVMWAGYQAHAKKQGLSLGPNEFVEQFVADNFPSIFDEADAQQGAPANSSKA